MREETILISFEDAIAKSEGIDRSLLLGNGFSARYFSYKNLLDQTDVKVGEPLRDLFNIYSTYDFELIIRSLEDAAQVEVAYKDDNRADLFRREAQRLREQLVHSIRSTHPTHVEDIEKHFPSTRAFLNNFSNYFTLNYDLLLYWIQLGTRNYSDGFGLAASGAGFRSPFRVGAHCNTFNMHGGLHLFLDDVGDLQKRIKGSSGIIDAIADTIVKKKRLPLYVAEGSSTEKMRKINSVPYLRHCFDSLADAGGVLFVFGHSASDNDEHIYRAVFSSNIEHIYFGVFEPDEEKIRACEAQLLKFRKLSGGVSEFTLYDSGSVNLWL